MSVESCSESAAKRQPLQPILPNQSATTISRNQSATTNLPHQPIRRNHSAPPISATNPPQPTCHRLSPYQRLWSTIPPPALRPSSPRQRRIDACSPIAVHSLFTSSHRPIAASTPLGCCPCASFSGPLLFCLCCHILCVWLIRRVSTLCTRRHRLSAVLPPSVCSPSPCFAPCYSIDACPPSAVFLLCCHRVCILHISFYIALFTDPRGLGALSTPSVWSCSAARFTSVPYCCFKPPFQ